MVELRIFLYAIGILSSVLVASQFLRLRHPLALTLALLMFIWAINCISLIANRLLLIAGASVQPWVLTANAALLAVGPVVPLIWFLRDHEV